MTIVESIVKSVSALPPEKKLEALALIQGRGQTPRRALISPEGIASHVAFDISLEEFQALRHDIWGTLNDRLRSKRAH